MAMEPADPRWHHVRRQLRILVILHAASRTGLEPLPLPLLHAIGYFADALAPVWDLRIVDARSLKHQDGPASPALQRDIDFLVGRGLVIPTGLGHVQRTDGTWRLDADYYLNQPMSDRVVRQLERSHLFSAELAFISELVYAMASLSLLDMAVAGRVDASYGDPLVDFGDLLDLTRGEEPNPSAAAAQRFAWLLRSQVDLTRSETIHMYVRHLYNLVEEAA